MYKQILVAASLALCLAGPAAADNDRHHDKGRPEKTMQARIKDLRDDHERERDRTRHRERGDDHGRGDWNHHDRDDRNDWHDHDRDDHWRRDDDWRHRGWHYQGGHADGWRYYRGHNHRHWRYVPPYRYGLDFGYRSGYELAWRDWLNYGRYDRYWRRTAFYGYGSGYAYRSGYDAGWRDAAIYYNRGYRPSYWSYDPHGGWYFGFSISG